MAQTGYSPILIYGSTTTGNTPAAGNLTTGTSGVELAINATDGKLFYKDNAGVVQTIATKAGAAGTFSNVTITGGSINGTTIGATTASTGAFTTLSASSTTTLSGGTANGVAYLNGSKAVTTGSALTFDGTYLNLNFVGQKLSDGYGLFWGSGTSTYVAGSGASNYINFVANSAEQMRLTSTGLGIGTSSPGYKLDVRGSAQNGIYYKSSGNYGAVVADNSSTTGGGAFSAWTNGAQKAAFGTSGWFKGDTSVDATLYAESGAGIQFMTNGSSTAKATIDSSGNLGIGVTPSGTYKLEVANGDASIYGVRVGRGAGAVASNTAVGASALAANTTGAQNTAVGNLAGATTNGAYLTAVGYQAARYNTGDGNTAIGNNALLVGSGTGGTGSYNTAVGKDSLLSNTTASNNTAVGYQAGYSTQTGGYITAVGYRAAYSTTGNYVTALGYRALDANTSGSLNTSVGMNSMFANITGSYNTALGHDALGSNTTASNNTAVGYQAGYTNSTGANNVFVGRLAGYYSTGGQNTSVGEESGYYTTGTNNTYLGYGAGPQSSGSTGSYNTLLGNLSGYLITTGSKNSILGCYNGNQGGLDIRTSSNNIVLSDGDGNPRMACNNSGTWNVNVGGAGVNNPQTLLAFFGGGSTTTAGVLRFGDGNITVGSTNYWDIGRDNASTGNFTFTLSGTQKGYISTSTGAYTAVSDSRLKKNIVPLQYGLAEVLALNPVMYNMAEELDTDKKHIGLIAQETKAVMDESVDDIKNEATEFYGLDKSGLVPVLIKAIQELKSELDSVKAELATLKGA